MNLPRRRWPALLLWLALALLPLRGWAEATMPLMMALGGGPASMQAAAPHNTSTMPCHAAAAMDATIDLAAAGASPADLAAVDSTSPGPNACSMCDLCHGAAADAPRAPSLPAAPPAATSLPEAPTLLEPAVLSGPERPPRPTTL